jgi:hypothetical protein
VSIKTASRVLMGFPSFGVEKSSETSLACASGERCQDSLRRVHYLAALTLPEVALAPCGLRSCDGKKMLKPIIYSASGLEFFVPSA